ncbi:MAG TPA: hypothetical protein VHH36_10065, partial [Candidatus Thermoplasmatota archaeon]|nr:hypothetical protein [Candidatus Thermoplasmatota archaeon]
AMRRRLPAIVALVLVPLVFPLGAGQASPAASAGDALAPSMASASPSVAAAPGALGAPGTTTEVCIDPGAVPWRPTSLVVLDGACTLRAFVEVRQAGYGVSVLVVLEVAETGRQVALECTDIRSLPHPRGSMERGECSPTRTLT